MCAERRRKSDSYDSWVTTVADTKKEIKKRKNKEKLRNGRVQTNLLEGCCKSLPNVSQHRDDVLPLPLMALNRAINGECHCHRPHSAFQTVDTAQSNERLEDPGEMSLLLWHAAVD